MLKSWEELWVSSSRRTKKAHVILRESVGILKATEGSDIQNPQRDWAHSNQILRCVHLRRLLGEEEQDARHSPRETRQVTGIYIET